MKKILQLTLVITLLFGCKEEQKERTTYVINGTAKEVYNGVRAHLNRIGPRGRLTPIDTAMVMNEVFKFEGQVETPELLYLTVNSVQGRLPVMIENSEMTFIVDKINILNSTVEGSESQAVYDQYEAEFKRIQEEYSELKTAYQDARQKKDSIAIATKYGEIVAKREAISNLPFEFMEAHTNSFVSLEIFKTVFNSRNKDNEKLLATFNNFDDAIKNSKSGQFVNAKLSRIRQEVEANKKLQPGNIAPMFSGPNPEGKAVALADITKNAKVTIVDFWAAWCGPCRRENPNVVNIYNKYHEEGLDIVGVSLDGDPGRRQLNPRESWLKAIEIDKLPWHQISNLKGFQGPIASMYNIRSIPATYILDTNGKIVAKNLRGQALENKIRELIGK